LSVTVQAFLVCRSVTVQPVSSLTDIVGVLDVVSAANFPLQVVDWAIYIRLLVFDEADCDAVVFVQSPSLVERQLMKAVKVKPDPNGKVKISLRIGKLELPEPGIYTLQLRVDGVIRSEYHVTAVKRRDRVRGPVSNP
jgi:hypothetical protein